MLIHDDLKSSGFHYMVFNLQLQTLKSRDCCEGGTTISLKKEAEGSWSNGSTDNSSDINLDLSRTPVMNSPVSSDQNGTKMQLLSASLKPITSMTQLLQCSSSRSDLQEESFCNMFHNIDDQQQSFWPWPEQNHTHFH